MPAALVHPLTVTVNEYSPAVVVLAVVVGFCKALVKAFGPDHAYVAEATVGTDNLISCPSHTGPLFVGTGV